MKSLLKSRQCLAIVSLAAAVSALNACSKDKSSDSPQNPVDNFKVKNTVDAEGLKVKSGQLTTMLSNIESKIGASDSKAPANNLAPSAMSMVKAFAASPGQAATATTTTTHTSTSTRTSSSSSSSSSPSTAALQGAKSCDDAFNAIKGMYGTTKEHVNSAIKMINTPPKNAKKLELDSSDAAIGFQMVDDEKSAQKSTIKASANETEMSIISEANAPGQNNTEGSKMSFAIKANLAQETIEMRNEMSLNFDFPAQGQPPQMGDKDSSGDFMKGGEGLSFAMPKSIQTLSTMNISGGKQPSLKESMNFSTIMVSKDSKSGEKKESAQSVSYELNVLRESDKRMTVAMKFDNKGMQSAMGDTKSETPQMPLAGEVFFALEKNDAGQCFLFDKDHKQLAGSTDNQPPGNDNNHDPKPHPVPGPVPQPEPKPIPAPTDEPTTFVEWCQATQKALNAKDFLTPAQTITEYILANYPKTGDESEINCDIQSGLVMAQPYLDLTSLIINRKEDLAPLRTLTNLQTVKLSNRTKRFLNGTCPFIGITKCEW